MESIGASPKQTAENRQYLSNGTLIQRPPDLNRQETREAHKIDMQLRDKQLKDRDIKRQQQIQAKARAFPFPKKSPRSVIYEDIEFNTSLSQSEEGNNGKGKSNEQEGLPPQRRNRKHERPIHSSGTAGSKPNKKYFPLCNGTITDPEDLIQSGYFAVLEAAKAFEPTYGCKFTTILHFHVQRVCLDQLGLRRKRLKTVSLSAPAGDDEDITIGDTIADDSNLYEYAELNEMQKTIREAVNELPNRHKYTIYRYYFGKGTIKQIGKELGVSGTMASEILKDAYYRLSQQKAVREMWTAYSEREPSEFWSPLEYAIAMEILEEKRKIPAPVTTIRSGLEMI